MSLSIRPVRACALLALSLLLASPPGTQAADGVDASAPAPPVPGAWAALDGAGRESLAEGRLTEAELLFREALAEARRDGERSAEAARSLQGLGATLRLQARYVEARAALEEAIALHPTGDGAHDARADLASVFRESGSYKEARALLLDLLKDTEARTGDHSDGTILLLLRLANAEAEGGQIDAALGRFERALAILEARGEGDGMVAAQARAAYGNTLRLAGRTKDARAALERGLAALERAQPEPGLETAVALANLGAVRLSQHDAPGARAALEQALPILERTTAPDHPLVASVRQDLGAVLAVSGDLGGALAQFDRALAIARLRLPAGHPQRALIARNYARVLRASDREEDATRIEAEEVPPDAPPGAVPGLRRPTGR